MFSMHNTTVTLVILLYITLLLFILLYMYTFLYITQVDLVELPPVIANRVLKRQPLNVFYLKKHLMRQARVAMPAPLPILSPALDEFSNESGRHFEEGLSIRAFIRPDLVRGRDIVSCPKDQSCLSHMGTENNSLFYSCAKSECHNSEETILPRPTSVHKHSTSI